MKAGILYAKRIEVPSYGHKMPSGPLLSGAQQWAIQCGACPRISKTDQEHDRHYVREHAVPLWRSWG